MQLRRHDGLGLLTRSTYEPREPLDGQSDVARSSAISRRIATIVPAIAARCRHADHGASTSARHLARSADRDRSIGTRSQRRGGRAAIPLIDRCSPASRLGADCQAAGGIAATSITCDQRSCATDLAARRSSRRCYRAHFAALRSASRTSASSVAPSPSSSSAAATAALAASAGRKPRLSSARDRVGAGADRRGDRRRAGGRARCRRPCPSVRGRCVRRAWGRRRWRARPSPCPARRSARARSAGSSADRIASATRAPTPCTPVSSRNQSRSAARAKPTRRMKSSADQHFGVEHRRLADRAERGQRAAGGADEIADAADVDHRMVDAGRFEPALQVRDHRRRGEVDEVADTCAQDRPAHRRRAGRDSDRERSRRDEVTIARH